MKPISLHLSGFIGIRSGLGRERIDLDLSDRQGLVAIVGPNGTGKTTILDNLHPYRVMPFRANGYGEGSFSFYEETTGDATKELIWSHEGITYRSDIRIKGGGKVKKTEATLYQQVGSEWAPVHAADGTASDGKTVTYDKCVHGICGTPEMFFTAAFSAQNRVGLCDYSASDMKLLLSELLGLDQYLELSRQAADAAKHVAAQAEGLTGQLQKLDADIALLDGMGVQVGAAETALNLAAANRSTARISVATRTTQLAEVKAADAAMETHRARRVQLQADRADALTRNTQRLAELDQAERSALRDFDATDLVETLSASKRRLAAAESAAERGRAAAIFGTTKDQAVFAATAAEAKVREVEAKEAAARTTYDDVQAAVSEVGRLKERLESKAREGKAAGEKLTAAKKRAGLLSTVPCAGMEIASSCALLADARDSDAEAERINAELIELRSDYEKSVADRAALEAKAVMSNAARAALDAATKELAEARSIHAKANADVTRAVEADQARARLSEAEAAIVTEKGGIADLEQRLASRKAEASAQMDDLKVKRTEHLAAHTHRIASIDADLLATPDPGNTNAVRDATDALAAAERDLATLEKAHADKQTALANLTAELAALQRRVDAGAAVRQQAIDAAEDQGQWRLLSKALGKDGIVALAIDDAGPAISTIANDLLSVCYGPRFSIRFDTQSAKADGTLKEDFDIRVFDAERNDDKSLSKTSGGEQLWLNEAITRAISLHKTLATGQAYECYFSDESDGALDGDRKEMFMRMKRRVLELGGADTEYYITHTPELWEMADSVIDTSALRA